MARARALNLPGGTILAGFLFQKRYNNCATCCCLETREAAGGHDARRRLMGYRTDLQAWVAQPNCALWWKRSKLKCSWSYTNVLHSTWLYVCVAATKKQEEGTFFEHISWQWFEHDTVSIDRRVIANTLDNRQIAANGQFTTDFPQRSAPLMTLSQTSGQVTVPGDRLGITAREVKEVKTLTPAVANHSPASAFFIHYQTLQGRGGAPLRWFLDTSTLF